MGLEMRRDDHVYSIASMLYEQSQPPPKERTLTTTDGREFSASADQLRIHYARVGTHPVATMVTYQEGGLLFYGISLCSPSDNFSKKVGIGIALGRLLEEMRDPKGVRAVGYFSGCTKGSGKTLVGWFKVAYAKDYAHLWVLAHPCCRRCGHPERKRK